jgi:hypothetical protein
MKTEGFIWYDDYWRPGDRGDSGHFEYHPNWDGRAGSSFLKMHEIRQSWKKSLEIGLSVDHGGSI